MVKRDHSLIFARASMSESRKEAPTPSELKTIEAFADAMATLKDALAASMAACVDMELMIRSLLETMFERARTPELNVVVADGQPVKEPRHPQETEVDELMLKSLVPLVPANDQELRKFAIRAMGGQGAWLVDKGGITHPSVEIEGQQVTANSYATLTQGERLAILKVGDQTSVHLLDVHSMKSDEYSAETREAIVRLAFAFSDEPVKVYRSAISDRLVLVDENMHWRAALFAWILLRDGMLKTAPTLINIIVTHVYPPLGEPLSGEPSLASWKQYPPHSPVSGRRMLRNTKTARILKEVEKGTETSITISATLDAEGWNGNNRPGNVLWHLTNVARDPKSGTGYGIGFKTAPARIREEAVLSLHLWEGKVLADYIFDGDYIPIDKKPVAPPKSKIDGTWTVRYPKVEMRFPRNRTMIQRLLNQALAHSEPFSVNEMASNLKIDFQQCRQTIMHAVDYGYAWCRSPDWNWAKIWRP